MAGRVVTIATQRGGVNVITKATAGVTSTKRPTFTGAHVADRNLLGRLLNQFVAWVEEATAPARSNPQNSGVLVRNIALSNGVTTQVPHLLGREPTGWYCVRARTAAFSAYETTLATGLDRKQYIALASNATGTYDLWVF